MMDVLCVASGWMEAIDSSVLGGKTAPKGASVADVHATVPGGLYIVGDDQ